MQQSNNLRTVRIFCYDPEKGGEGHFQTYSLAIEKLDITIILGVLIRIQKERTPASPSVSSAG